MRYNPISVEVVNINIPDKRVRGAQQRCKWLENASCRASVAVEDIIPVRSTHYRAVLSGFIATDVSLIGVSGCCAIAIINKAIYKIPATRRAFIYTSLITNC